MSKTTEEVKRDVTGGAVEILSSFGMSPTVTQLYLELFFSGEPLGLKELSGRTGYSVSTVCTSMDLLESMLDVRKFTKPGSKKVYYICEHDTKPVFHKKWMMSHKALHSIIEKLGAAEARLRDDRSPEAKSMRAYVAKLRMDYELAHSILTKMLEFYSHEALMKNGKEERQKKRK